MRRPAFGTLSKAINSGKVIRKPTFLPGLDSSLTKQFHGNKCHHRHPLHRRKFPIHTLGPQPGPGLDLRPCYAL